VRPIRSGEVGSSGEVRVRVELHAPRIDYWPLMLIYVTIYWPLCLTCSASCLFGVFSSADLCLVEPQSQSQASSTGKRFFMSFRVSDPQIYEFTICFTSQSPISGLSSPQVCNSEIQSCTRTFELSMKNQTPLELADFHFNNGFPPKVSYVLRN
jgi:hypothetical protein